MMNDLASLIGFLQTAGLLAIPIALLLWLAHGSDSPAGSSFGMRFDASSPPIPEEVDPPRWRIELIGGGRVTSGRSTQVPVERPAFSGNQPTLRPSSERAHAE
jgi:hypothetical protein